MNGFQLYKNVTIKPASVDKVTELAANLIEFEMTKSLAKIRWEVSKRLKYGALVCFSRDQFHSHFQFATVHDRDDEQLKKGILKVCLLDDISQMDYNARCSA